MDGKEALDRLYALLNEDSGSSFIDRKTSFDFLNEAAVAAAMRSKMLRTTQTITSVANQQAYSLNADFLELYTRDYDNRLFINYNNGTDNFIRWMDYDDILYSQLTTGTPGYFSIISATSVPSRVTGTATATSTPTGGESTLAGSGFDNVSAGDTVHNTTDGSTGVVLSVTSSTSIVTALFGGTNNYWTSGDSYVIQPEGRSQLVLSPTPNTSGDTVTVYYVKRPDPVYSDYGSFPFPAQYMPALIKYAAWLYKYRDRDPNFGDVFYREFERQFRSVANSTNKRFNRTKFKMSLKREKY